MPVVGMWHAWSQLSLMWPLWRRDSCYLHFTEKKIKAQRDEAIHPQSPMAVEILKQLEHKIDVPNVHKDVFQWLCRECKRLPFSLYLLILISWNRGAWVPTWLSFSSCFHSREFLIVILKYIPYFFSLCFQRLWYGFSDSGVGSFWA